ncbi:Hypothetical protein CINCED_3A006327 [Cinara cedri]|nr:Hypothetical protein CINCED_3A006327 [Cinara cedri]
MKILEIGKWLEHLDQGTDEFYLSINIGLKHIKMANFIHMQFAANDTRGFKQLFEEIVLFKDMNNKAKATIYAIHAVILIEYNEHLNCFKNACEYANEACILDPEISDWFHIYLFVLITQRRFMHSSKCTSDKSVLLTNKLYPGDNEIRLTLQKALTSSGIKSTRYVNSLVLAALNQFFATEFQMESNNVPALKIQINKESIESYFKEDIKILVKKYKNGEDVAPYLTVLVSKYKYNRWTIWAQICSYTMLFNNNFRDGVEQFLSLIEDRKMSPRELKRHKSLFMNNPKPFNLSELVRSEISFATKNSSSAIEDLLFFFKIFLKIEEVYISKMKVEIPLLKTTKISNTSISKCSSTSAMSKDKTNLSIDESVSSSISTCSNASYQDEFNKTNNESDIDKSEDIIIKRKNRTRKRKKKHLENTTPRLFTNGSKLDQKNDTPEKYLNSESVLKSEIEMKNEMKLNEKYFMDFFISSIILFDNVCSNKSYPGLAGHVRSLQMQTEMFNFLQQNNLQNITIQNHNRYFNQNFVHFNFLHANHFSTSILLPPLLDLKLDLLFQSKINANLNSINMGSMKIDTSLSKLPRLSTSQNTYKLSLKCILLNYPYSFKIYTDASKIQNNVGIAMVSDKDTYTYKLLPEYTSCDAEAVAILLALDYALAQNYFDYLILTDSLSILTCIQNENISSDVINSILHLIYANRLKGNKINFIWVPSHNSIEGNEIADRLARIVATSPNAITYSHNSFVQTKLK